MSQMMPPPSTSPEKLEGKGNSPFLKWILALIIIGFLIFGTATAYYLLLTQKELNQARKTQEKLEKELTKTKKS